jgi:hypothetical protein
MRGEAELLVERRRRAAEEGGDPLVLLGAVGLGDGGGVADLLVVVGEEGPVADRELLAGVRARFATLVRISLISVSVTV